MANTTSGTVTFDKTFAVEEIIEEAYERIGVQVSSGYQLKTARRSLNILFQEWGNRGIHYWEIGELDLDLVEGQAEYKFFRSSGDGTSATTVPANTFGVADVLEATLRSDRTATDQADSALTKIDRSTYSALSNKPRGKYLIKLCRSTSCLINNYQSARDILERELHIKMGETT